MNALKPLFFGKYKPRNQYTYSSDWQDHSLKRKRGQLSIKIRETQSDPKAIVILSHPMKEMGKYYFVEYGHADLYNSMGYHVVIFDFNGFGDSTDSKDFEFKADIIDVINQVKTLYPDFSIGLHGVSFGASQIILASLEDESQINGLVVESAVSSNIDYYKGRGSYLFHLLNAYNVFFPKKNAHNIYTTVVQQLKQTPVLYLYGEKDVITPLWMGEKLYQNTGSYEKELVVLDGKHLTLISDQPQLYRDSLQRFWERIK